VNAKAQKLRIHYTVEHHTTRVAGVLVMPALRLPLKVSQRAGKTSAINFKSAHKFPSKLLELYRKGGGLKNKLTLKSLQYKLLLLQGGAFKRGPGGCRGRD
jgi:hypothetical protein